MARTHAVDEVRTATLAILFLKPTVVLGAFDEGVDGHVPPIFVGGTSFLKGEVLSCKAILFFHAPIIY